MEWRRFALALAGAALAATAGAAAPSRPRHQEGADIGEAISRTENIDQRRLQKDPAYARDMLVHLDAMRRVAGDSPDYAAYIEEMRVMAFIGLQRYGDAIAVGKALLTAHPKVPAGYPLTMMAAVKAERPLDGLWALEWGAAQVHEAEALRAVHDAIPPALTNALLKQIAHSGVEGALGRAAKALAALGWPTQPAPAPASPAP